MIKPNKRPADSSSKTSAAPIKIKKPKVEILDRSIPKVAYKADQFSKNGKVRHGKSGAKGNIHNEMEAKSVSQCQEMQQQSAEKTDWAKFKKDKKELKMKRKQAKDHYEIVADAKKIYEKLKCKRTEKKSDLVSELYKMLEKGDMLKKVVMAHDTARVVQCMLKFASPPLRDQLSDKLMPLVVEMCVSKYSHFCVLRMLKYGSPTTKSKLVDNLLGNMVRLACHSISSKILDHIYLAVATNKQKIFMRQEFYGDLYKKLKDNNVKTLNDTYKDDHNMKASILSAVKSNLEHVANKNLLDSSLVHAVLLEYIYEIDDEKLEEAIGFYASQIPLLLSTKEGSKASTYLFYKASTKNRRAIVKAIKDHLVKICTHEHGHVFLIAILNSLDDTKAIKKAIFDTFYPEIQTLLSNQHGRKVIEWLVSPADKNCFHPAFIAKIEEGLQYSKKEKNTRRKEILEQIEEPLTEAIIQNPKLYLSNGHIGLVTAEILKNLHGDNYTKAVESLGGVIVNPKWSVTIEEETKEKAAKKAKDIEQIIEEASVSKKKMKIIETNNEEKNEEDSSSDEEEENVEKDSDLKTFSGIEEPGLHITLKKIIKHDKFVLEQNSESQTFGSILVRHLNDETLRYWLTVNRACFVLLNVVEQNNKETLQSLKSLLKPFNSLLEQQTSKGAQLLHKKLSF